MRLCLTRQEREQLKQLARRTKDARLLRRAQALLDLDAGERPGDVARRYHVARSTIYNWIGRCHARGLSDEALGDLPRPGRPPRRHEKTQQAGDHNAT
jgi:transposase